MVLHLNKLESLSPKDALCQDWLKLAWWFGGRFFNFRQYLMYFRYFVIIYPLKKSVALYLKKMESPSIKDVLCQVWLKLAQWFWRRRWKYEKFTTRTITTTDKFWSEKLTWAFGLGELKTAWCNKIKTLCMLYNSIF